MKCGGCHQIETLKHRLTVAVDVGIGKEWEWWNQRCYDRASGLKR